MVDVGKLEVEFSSLEQKASAPEFWDNQETAQAVLQQMSDLKSSLDSARGLQALLSDAQTAVELAELEVLTPDHPNALLLGFISRSLSQSKPCSCAVNAAKEFHSLGLLFHVQTPICEDLMFSSSVSEI